MKEREKIAELSDNKSKGFQSKAAQLLKTTYENGDDIQSEDWEGSSVTRVIRDACVHFESEITLPINNDKGNQGLSFIFFSQKMIKFFLNVYHFMYGNLFFRTTHTFI